MEHPEDKAGGEVIDLTEMLRASLSRAAGKGGAPAKRPAKADVGSARTELAPAAPAKAKRAPASGAAKAQPAPRVRAAGGSKK